MFSFTRRPSPIARDVDDNEKDEKLAADAVISASLEDDEHLASEGIDAETWHYTMDEIQNYEIDPELNARVLRKLDSRVLVLVFFMYLFSALDRGNLSNAQTDGMTKDLHFVGNQYNVMLSAFFVPFCTMAIPGALMTKRFGPHRMLPLYMIGWGSMAMLNAACKNYGGVVAVRMILGMFEGFFGPSLAVFLSLYYTRAEMGKRMAAWYSSAAISGAFSGLLSYGIFRIKSHLKGWQILFLLEGGLTLLTALISVLVLPPHPTKCKFLTKEEKKAAVMRLLKDASYKVNAPWDWNEVFLPLKDWKFYVWMAYALCYGTGASTASTFLAQILGRFHYSTVKTNLYTVAPNVVSAVTLWITVFSSDYFRERSLHLMTANSMTFVGCLALALLPVTNVHAGYAMCFLISMGAFTPTCIFHTWHNNNDPNENGRAFRTGVMTFAANAGGIVSANIFLQTEAPKYTRALIVSAAMEATGIFILICLRTYMWLDNRKRNKAQGVNWTTKDVPTAALHEGPKNPSFRHFL